jgi:NitT/TauT family transport system substrate-binding protein
MLCQKPKWPVFRHHTTLLTLLAVSLLIFCRAALAQSPVEQTLRVQLLWYHQTQFSGFYVAQARKHFQAEGLDVVFHEGGSGLNPIVELQEGRADIAVSWLGNAWGLSAPDRRVTNIAQIFSGASLAVICRISAGVYTAKDVQGKKIGVWNLGDEHIVKEMLRRLSVPIDTVELVPQRPGGLDLIEGEMPCVTAMTYNEYWKILQAGIPATDLIIVSPELFEIPHIEDGLYVMTERLQSDAFKDQLARFLRAVRRGWMESRLAPTLAIETVQRLETRIDRDHQRHMLETVIATVPDEKSFGFFDLGRYQAAVHTLLGQGSQSPPPSIWTHAVWNRVKEMDRQDKPLTPATTFYASDVINNPAFKFFLIFGVMTFALSGVLEAINRGYDIWGRLILAFLSGLGGGTLRDFLIGAERMPLYYVKELVYPLGILAIVAAASVLTAIYRNLHQTETFKTVKKYADVIGFSVLAIAGAKIAIASSLAWYWAPICAALTCAGGGMLRDIVVNQEPATFKGVIYEEVAVIGALIFIGGLMIANYFEATPVPVYLSILLGIVTIILMRLAVYHYQLRYPRALGGQAKPTGH